MRPSVSIIIPAYNEAGFLAGLLESLRKHLPFDAEVIVVDNGSSDETSAVATRGGCRVVRVEDRLFPSQARNLGVAHASGAVLVFLDADVEVTPEWGRELQSGLASYPTAPLQVTGDQYHISKQPSWIERTWFAPLRQRKQTYINGGNLITTRDVFERVGGFSADLETGEDVDFCVRAVRAGAVLTLNEGFKVFHEGYPKTISRFLKRERWHGTGDFLSLQTLLGSAVAVTALLFLFLHAVFIAALAGAVFGGTGAALAIISVLMVLGLCAAASAKKFRTIAPTFLVKTIPITYLYYLGRAWSALDSLRRHALGRTKIVRHR